MSRKSNDTAKRKKPATLSEFKSNFSDSLPVCNISGDKLLEGEMLSRSLRASSTKSSQPPSQDDTEWWVRRKNSTDRRKNDDARFQSPIKTLPQVAEHIVQQNQPKYLFQDELELIKNESPLSNKTKSSAVVVKRDMPGVKLQGHSMKSLAMDILFCEQCASFSRISGTAGSSNLPHQHQTDSLPSARAQEVELEGNQELSDEDSNPDVLIKSASKPWTYERRFDSDSDCDY